MSPHQRLVFDIIPAAFALLTTAYLVITRYKPSIIKPRYRQLPYSGQVLSTQFLIISILLTVSFLADVVLDIVAIQQGLLSLELKTYSFLFTFATSIAALIIAYRLFIKKK